jgi:hypothetical protein
MDHTVISTTSSISCSSSSDRTPLPSPVRSYSNGSRIRRNLLFKLGVPAHGDVSPSPVRAAPRSLLGDVRKTLVPLKCYDEEQGARPLSAQSPFRLVQGSSSTETDSEHTRSCCTISPSTEYSIQATLRGKDLPRRRKTLTFGKEVLVCPIARRSEYSKRIKDCLWTPAAEAARDFSRNAIEFAAEGNDWRYVLEDADMYRDPVTQERIHPIHIELWREQSGMDSEDFFDSQKTQEFYHTT